MFNTVRRQLKYSIVSTLARLPVSMQVRLFGELAQLLSSRPAEVVGLMSRLPSAQRALLRAVENLGAQASEITEPALKRLSRAQQISLFRELAQALDVPAVETIGRNGTLIGYLDDDGVFIPYLCDRSWFWNAIEFINSFFCSCPYGTFIDVGANIGAVVVPVAKANPSIECFAFEPAPNNFLALSHNIARNGVTKNVKAYETALADVDGAVTFELDGTNFGDHRVRRCAGGAAMFDEETRRTIEVRARRLDGILNPSELAHPLVVKIDVQGAELMVLAGGNSILEAADVLIVEYWPYGLRRLGGEPRQFLEVFSQIFPLAAYVTERAIRADDFVRFSAMLAELEDFAGRSGTAHLNLVLAKRPIAAITGEAG